MVVAARRLTDGLAAVRDAFDDVLLLRASNRQEHQLLALSGERFDPDLPPGGGWWHGERIQVFAPGARALVDVSPPPPDVPIGSVPVAVLTNRARAVRSRLEALGVAVSSVQEAVAGGPTDAVVGTVLEWSSSRGCSRRCGETGPSSSTSRRARRAWCSERWGRLRSARETGC